MPTPKAATAASPPTPSAASPRWRASVALLAIGTFAVGTDAFVIAGVLPDIADSLRVSVAAAGQLVTVFALAYAMAAPFVGSLTAGWSRRTTLLTALTVFALGNAITALAPTYPLVLGSRVVAAAGTALYTASASATAARLAGPQSRGRAIAIVMLGLTSSLVLGTPIGTAVSSLASWRVTLWLVSAIAVLGAAAIATLLPRLAGDGASPLAGLRRLKDPLRDRRVLRLLGGTFMAFVGIYTPYTYFSVVYAPITDESGHRLALLLFAFGIAATLGNLAAGTLSDRVGPTRVTVAATLLLTLLFVALPLLRGTVWLAIPAILLSGVLSFSVTTPQQHRLIALAPNAGPVVTGLYQAAVYLAVSASGVVGALGLATTGAAYLGPLAAAFALGAAGLTAWSAARLGHGTLTPDSACRVPHADRGSS